MPKGKGKQAGAAAEGGGGRGGAAKQKSLQSSTDDLPQVWLPNQPADLSASFEFNYTSTPPLLAAATPADFTTPQASPSHALTPPLSTAKAASPSSKEQEQVAMFWEMEEANAPSGWDDGQEVDYSEVSRRREEQITRPTGNPDRFKYAQSSLFTLNYLGHLGNLPKQREGSPTDILEAIDTAQRQGRLPWIAPSLDQRILSVSKYGIKVMDARKQRVFIRHPLHCIIDITYYEDTYGKHMLALRVGRLDQGGVCDVFVYQSSDEAQAKDICLTLAQAFEVVLSKVRLEKNLRSSDPR